ncbi:ABC transporter ATP-binding protein [Nitrosopumilus sp. S4]
MTLLSNYILDHTYVDRVKNFEGIPKNNVVFRDFGAVFNFGGILEINPISISKDYSITCWFEWPLPETALYYNSLCSDGKDNVPVLVRRKDFHLGVWDPVNKQLNDSGFNMSSLSDGIHFLVARGNNDKNITEFYLDGKFVGKSTIKLNSSITQIGNNGEDNNFFQPFGWIWDFNIFDELINDHDISKKFKIGSAILKDNFDDPNTNTAIELRNVSKSFTLYHEKPQTIFDNLCSIFNGNKKEKLHVLKNISFSVKKGEMIGILGFNGSGKTTLLKIISKIFNPSSGKIHNNGKLIPLIELGIGFNGELTAYDNIIQYGVILGFSKKEMKDKIKSIIEFAELESFLDTKLKHFSSGMYVRLAFSTAIQVNPDILILDEILAVGDIKFQQKSFDAIMKFKNDGKTIVIVTQSPDIVRKYCDTALWIHDGILQSYGDPNKVTLEYETLAFKNN